MQPYNHKPMLMFAGWLVASLLAGAAHAEYRAAKDEAVQLGAIAGNVQSVSFYVVASTGRYSLQGEAFKKASTLRVFRSCGGNCRMFLKPLLDHLSGATPGKCLVGQKNVLVEIGDKASLVYSYSGKVIQVDGRCYLSQQSVGEILRKAGFFLD
ncbi:hypothetical protein ABZR86_06925 [Dyella marensis]|nr:MULTISPECIES: hypothetical protein [Dyella]